ncbi:hypothetical protein ACFVS2_26070 [Brevibacillus sp. NPDC058079]|uniref:hypothetical protein n=1 Tax=Brevibacillus sp. NPDC058079 TaxID=3346330 RepID=UPI0036F07BB6
MKEYGKAKNIRINIFEDSWIANLENEVNEFFRNNPDNEILDIYLERGRVPGVPDKLLVISRTQGEE